MSAVSISVTPASSAASTTARVPSRSTRMPKLLLPSPTTETSGPSAPKRRVRTSRDARASGMRYRQLGSSDLDVSEISLGSWLTYGGGVARERAEACVTKAFEVGINFIDTANVYARGGAAGGDDGGADGGRSPGEGAVRRVQRMEGAADPGGARPRPAGREVRVE